MFRTQPGWINSEVCNVGRYIDAFAHTRAGLKPQEWRCVCDRETVLSWLIYPI